MSNSFSSRIDTSSIGVPEIRSNVRTRLPVRAQSILGTLKLGSFSKLRRSSSPAAASNRKSISIETVWENVFTTSIGRRRLVFGRRRSKVTASQRNKSSSRLNAASIPGRKIFTATGISSVVMAK